MTGSRPGGWHAMFFIGAVVATAAFLYLTLPDRREGYVWLAQEVLLSFGAVFIAAPIGIIAALRRVFREGRWLRRVHFGAMYILLVADLALFLMGWWEEASRFDYGTYVLEWPIALSTILVSFLTPVGRWLRTGLGRHPNGQA